MTTVAPPQFQSENGQHEPPTNNLNAQSASADCRPEAPLPRFQSLVAPHITLPIIAAGALFQLYLVLRFHADMSAIERLMPDDAFYYFKISQNIAHGLGSVFSRGDPTNGYHPLWMVALVAIQLAFHPGQLQFIQLVLGLAWCLNLASGLALSRLLPEIGLSEEQSALGVAIFMLSPWFIFISYCGLEIPLYLLCLFLFMRACKRVLDRDTPRAWVMLGVACGFLMLARTDAIFFALFTYGYFAVQRRRALPLLGSGAIAALIVSPWLAWNLLTFGTIVQSSGTAIAGLVRYMMPTYAHRGLFGYTRYCFDQHLLRFYQTYLEILVVPNGYSLYDGAVLILQIELIAAYVLLYQHRKLNRFQPFPLSFWAFPAMAEMAFYFYGRLFTQVWHTVSFSVFLLLLLCTAIPREWLKRWMIPALCLALAAVALRASGRCYFPAQQELGPIARIRRLDFAERNKTVGYTDCGYVGYWNTLNTVVNLDGVVNNRCATAIVKGQFSAYVAGRHCDTVAFDRKRLAYYDRNIGAVHPPPPPLPYDPREPGDREVGSVGSIGSAGRSRRGEP